MEMIHPDQMRRRDEALSRQIQANNTQITRLLEQNCAMAARLQTMDPSQLKAGFPRHQVRTKQQVIRKYHLDVICADPIVLDNLAYCLELHDLLTSVDSMFHFFGAIEVTYHKNIVVNLVSIMETAVMQTCEVLGADPGRLKRFRAHPKHHYNGRDYMDALKAIRAVGAEDVKQFNVWYSKRNAVHIEASEANEIKEKRFEENQSALCAAFMEHLLDVLYQSIQNKRPSRKG